MSISDILALAELVKTETGISKNTAIRIGTALEEIIKYFRDNGGSGGGTSFVGAPITTSEQLDALITPGVYAIQMAAAYSDFGTANFNVLVMPMGNGTNNFVQTCFVFSATDVFSIRSRWCAYAPPVIANPAWSEWKNETSQDSGITPTTETVLLTNENPTYIITDDTAELLSVTNSSDSGEVVMDILSADKHLTIQIFRNNTLVTTPDGGVEYQNGDTIFASYEAATGIWYVTDTEISVIADYGDVTVDHAIANPNMTVKPGYFILPDFSFLLNELVLISDHSIKSRIGLYKSFGTIAGVGTTVVQIALGNKLNTVRVKNANVLISQYDGVNTSSLKFSEMSTKEYAESLVVNLWKDKGNYNPNDNNNQYPSVTGIKKGWLWVISGLGTGVTTTMGSAVVQDGDTVRALVDNPGQTNSNWTTLENNLGFTPENQANKTDDVESNKTSSTKFASVKGIADWVTAWFAKKIGINRISVSTNGADVPAGGANGSHVDSAGLYTAGYIRAGNGIIISGLNISTVYGHIMNFFTNKFSIAADGVINFLSGIYSYKAASITTDTIGDKRYKNLSGVDITEICTNGAATKGGGTWELIEEKKKVNYITIIAGGGSYSFIHNTINNMREVKMLSGTHNFNFVEPNGKFCPNECYISYVVGDTVPTINRNMPNVTGQGTASFTAGGQIVTITGTDATRFFKAGRTIKDSLNNVYTILTVDSATQVTLTGPASVTLTNVAYKYVPIIIGQLPTLSANMSVDVSYIWHWNNYGWMVILSHKPIKL